MMLIIRASVLNSYGKNVAKPRYDQKDDQFAKYCHTPLNLRIHLVFGCLSSSGTFCNSYLKILVEPHYERNDDQFAKYSQTLRNHCFDIDFQNPVRRLKIILPSLFFLLIIRASLWSPYGKDVAKPRYDQKDDVIAKYCHKLCNLRIHLVFLCLSSNRYFGTLTLKFLLNPITKQTITNLQNTVKRLGIIVFWKCFVADHYSEILDFLL